MANSPIDLADLDQSLGALGMARFGRFTIESRHCPKGREAIAGRDAFLIGNAGGRMWEVFSRSGFLSDGEPHPMDRWTRDGVTTLCAEFGFDPLFPFEKPFWPFQQFAIAATGMKSSPLGLLIHPEYGLWQAYRAVLVLGASQKSRSQISGLAGHDEKLIHPCDNCVDKPCLSACPVEAFTGTTLEADLCRTHLASGEDPDCMGIGCRARAACPVGKAYEYPQAQVQFHMRSFRGA